MKSGNLYKVVDEEYYDVYHVGCDTINITNCNGILYTENWMCAIYKNKIFMVIQKENELENNWIIYRVLYENKIGLVQITRNADNFLDKKHYAKDVYGGSHARVDLKMISE